MFVFDDYCSVSISQRKLIGFIRALYHPNERTCKPFYHSQISNNQDRMSSLDFNKMPPKAFVYTIW